MNAMKDAETQTEQNSISYVPPRVLMTMQMNYHPYPSWFYKPHMVMTLLAICFGVGFYGYNYSIESGDNAFITNAK